MQDLKLNFQRAIWVAATGIVLAALLATLALRPAPHGPEGKEGEIVADFALPRVAADGLDETVLDGPINHLGKPFLLHFWAPSCEPCRDELPLWEELSHHGETFTVLSVAGDDLEDVVDYMNAQHLTMHTVWDEEGTAHRKLNVWGIPHTFAISRTGVVVRDLTGAQSKETLSDALAAATAAK